MVYPHESLNSPVVETGRTNVGAEMALHVAQLGLLQKVLQRGERQLPDEPNRGFRIEYLEGEHLRESMPVEAVFPNSDDFRAKEFARQYVSGETPVEIVEDAWSGVNRGLPGFVVYFPVAASKYRQAVAVGQAQADLFGAEGKVMHTESGADVLDALVDSNQKQAAIKDYYHKQPHAVERNYIKDLEGITYSDRSDAREELQKVSEVYELNDGARSIRLVNFSSTQLNEEQLRQAVNTVRAISDRSGGELFERLYTIAIVPEEYRSMQQPVELNDGKTVMLPINGYQSPHLLALSDRLIKPPEERKPLSEHAEAFFENHRLPQEGVEGSSSIRDKVSDEGWELTLAHELTHIALPEDIQRTTPLPGPAPTLYGRYNKAEHIAELGAAEYAGGEQAQEVPDDQRKAFQQMWQLQRGSYGDGVEYKQPLGPHYVVCRELDITQGPLPLRVQHPNQPLAIEVNYRLIPDA